MNYLVGYSISPLIAFFSDSVCDFHIDRVENNFLLYDIEIYVTMFNYSKFITE